MTSGHGLYSPVERVEREGQDEKRNGRARIDGQADKQVRDDLKRKAGY